MVVESIDTQKSASTDLFEPKIAIVERKLIVNYCLSPISGLPSFKYLNVPSCSIETKKFAY